MRSVQLNSRPAPLLDGKAKRSSLNDEIQDLYQSWVKEIPSTLAYQTNEELSRKVVQAK